MHTYEPTGNSGFFVFLQIGREYSHLKRIFYERNSRQGANQYTERASDKPLSEAPPTKQAAAAIGVSQPTANKAEKVVIAIDELKAQGARVDLNGTSVSDKTEVPPTKQAAAAIFSLRGNYGSYLRKS